MTPRRLLVLLLVLLLSGLVRCQSTVYVALPPLGSDQGDGSVDKPYASLDQARKVLDSRRPGQVVLLSYGPEPFALQQSTWLLAANFSLSGWPHKATLKLATPLDDFAFRVPDCLSLEAGTTFHFGNLQLVDVANGVFAAASLGARVLFDNVDFADVTLRERVRPWLQISAADVQASNCTFTGSTLLQNALLVYGGQPSLCVRALASAEPPRLALTDVRFAGHLLRCSALPCPALVSVKWSDPASWLVDAALLRVDFTDVAGQGSLLATPLNEKGVKQQARLFSDKPLVPVRLLSLTDVQLHDLRVDVLDDGGLALLALFADVVDVLRLTVERCVVAKPLLSAAAAAAATVQTLQLQHVNDSDAGFAQRFCGSYVELGALQAGATATLSGARFAHTRQSGSVGLLVVGCPRLASPFADVSVNDVSFADGQLSSAQLALAVVADARLQLADASFAGMTGAPGAPSMRELAPSLLYAAAGSDAGNVRLQLDVSGVSLLDCTVSNGHALRVDALGPQLASSVSNVQLRGGVLDRVACAGLETQCASSAPLLFTNVGVVDDVTVQDFAVVEAQPPNAPPPPPLLACAYTGGGGGEPLVSGLLLSNVQWSAAALLVELAHSSDGSGGALSATDWQLYGVHGQGVGCQASGSGFTLLVSDWIVDGVTGGGSVLFNWNCGGDFAVQVRDVQLSNFDGVALNLTAGGQLTVADSRVSAAASTAAAALLLAPGASSDTPALLVDNVQLTAGRLAVAGWPDWRWFGSALLRRSTLTGGQRPLPDLGGCLQVDAVQALRVDDVLFKCCQAQRGGGLAASNVADGRLQSVRFVSDDAALQGSAVYLLASSFVANYSQLRALSCLHDAPAPAPFALADDVSSLLDANTAVTPCPRCANGGQLVTSCPWLSCRCPAGWTGPQCEEAVPPGPRLLAAVQTDNVLQLTFDSGVGWLGAASSDCTAWLLLGAGLPADSPCRVEAQRAPSARTDVLLLLGVDTNVAIGDTLSLRDGQTVLGGQLGAAWGTAVVGGTPAAVYGLYGPSKLPRNCSGAAVLLDYSVQLLSGFLPQPRYAWYLDGRLLPDATGSAVSLRAADLPPSPAVHTVRAEVRQHTLPSFVARSQLLVASAAAASPLSLRLFADRALTAQPGGSLFVFAELLPSPCAPANATSYSYAWSVSPPQTRSRADTVLQIVDYSPAQRYTVGLAVTYRTAAGDSGQIVAEPLVLEPLRVLLDVQPDRVPASALAVPGRAELLRVKVSCSLYPQLAAFYYRFAWSCWSTDTGGALPDVASDSASLLLSNTTGGNIACTVDVTLDNAVLASRQIDERSAATALLGAFTFYRSFTAAAVNISATVQPLVSGGYAVLIDWTPPELSVPAAALSFAFALADGDRPLSLSLAPGGAGRIAAYCSFGVCGSVDSLCAPPPPDSAGSFSGGVPLRVEGTFGAAAAPFTLLTYVPPAGLPPSDGACSCLALSGNASAYGVAGSTYYRVSCLDWQANVVYANVNTLTYALSVRVLGDNATQLIGYGSSISNVGFVLPAGNAAYDYAVEVAVNISNAELGQVFRTVCVQRVKPFDQQQLPVVLGALLANVDSHAVADPRLALLQLTTIVATAADYNLLLLPDQPLAVVAALSGAAAGNAQVVVQLIGAVELLTSVAATTRAMTVDQVFQVVALLQDALPALLEPGNELAVRALPSIIAVVDHLATYGSRLNRYFGALQRTLAMLQDVVLSLNEGLCGVPSCQYNAGSGFQFFAGSVPSSQADFGFGGATVFQLGDAVLALDNNSSSSCRFAAVSAFARAVGDRSPPQSLTLYQIGGGELAVHNVSGDGVKIWLPFPDDDTCGYDSADVTCNFLDESDSAAGDQPVWLATGCREARRNHSGVMCKCNHLSTFAALLGFDTVNNQCGWNWMQIASLTCVCVAITVILLALVLGELRRRYERSDSSTPVVRLFAGKTPARSREKLSRGASMSSVGAVSTMSVAS